MTHLSGVYPARPDAGSPAAPATERTAFDATSGRRDSSMRQDVRKTYAIIRGAAHGISFSCFTPERRPGRKPKNSREGQQ